MHLKVGGEMESKKASANNIGVFQYVIFYAGEMEPKKATANNIGIF
jgi:hypothetical protein